MEPKNKIVVTDRDEIVAAFTRWHSACGVDADGNVIGTTPDDPALMTDILLGHLADHRAATSEA